MSTSPFTVAIYNPALLKKEEDRLKKERKTRQYWIEGTMTLGIPILFAALGLVLWRLREGRR